MNPSSPKQAYLFLAAAALLWVGLFFFVQSLHAREDTIIRTIRTIKNVQTNDEGQSQLSALLSTTADERSHINDLLSIDVLTLANTVVGAGTDAGVTLTVSNAMPENVPPSGKTGKQLSAIGFMVDGQGSFGQLQHALALLEALPIPSTIEDATITRTDNKNDANKGGPWTLHVHLKILTILPISS